MFDCKIYGFTGLCVLIISLLFFTNPFHAEETSLSSDLLQKIEKELLEKHGAQQKDRIEKGVRQAASLWRTEDGDAQAFQEFVRTHFISDSKILDQTFERFQYNLEQLGGYLHEIQVSFRRQSDLDIGPVLPVDEILGAYDPYAHIADDFFENKLAFVALLNFPLTTLDQRLAEGEKWNRREWAEARLAQQFSRRIPAAVQAEITKTGAEAELYISEYNIWMHHLLDANGKRLFPPKLRLLSHWNLRDELKADYSEPDGIAKQRMIQKVMERIVTQTIPESVINNPHVDWNPETNEVTPAAVQDSDQPASSKSASNQPEPDTRYQILLNNFLANRKADVYSPQAPTLIDRKFNDEREIPEARVKTMFETVLSSPDVARVAKLIESRLGRKLEPFDIWYNGFKPRQKYTEQELDSIVSKKYPDPEAYAADIPRMLQGLGFSKEKADFVASKIVVDPARGSGHAWGAERRGEVSHLRTRVEKAGMNYKGYNIAVHEMGHNVEQTFSLYEIDYYTLHGVPNTAFTEALAFVFQAHDLELLGLTQPDTRSKALNTLASFWSAYENAGVGLVDMGVWRWMYEHPDATAAQLKEATLQIAKDIWNRYYAPVFGVKDVTLLAIYSHMIERYLYLPDYPIGRMIAFQIEEQMEKSGNIGPEFERITKLGAIAPDLWMKQATGAPVGPDALLRATESALKELSQ